MAGMAFDRRRANGPEITYPPLYDIFVSNDKQKTPLWSLDEHQLLLDPKSLPAQDLCLHDISLGADNLPISRIVRKDPSEREEGRAPLEFRKMYLQTGIIPSANGSALLEAGRTKIACSVHGPRQVRGRQYAGKAELNVQFQMAPFSRVEHLKPGKEAEVASPAALVQQALLPAVRLELLPKSSIDVHVTVLDADTSMLGYSALAVTAASAALAEAGVEMLGLVTGAAASAVVSLPEEGYQQQLWLVDPSHKEAAHANTHLMVCSMPALGRTTCYNLQGPVTEPSKLKETTDALISAASQLHGVTAQALFRQNV